MRYLLFYQLRERGIDYSREHIRRLEKLGLFPMHFNLDPAGRRIAWETALIEKHLAKKDKAARAAAKEARAKMKDRAEQERVEARREALPEIGGPNDA